MNVASDQVVDRATAEALTVDAYRDRVLVAWIVLRDQPQPGAFLARLVTETPTPYVLVGDTLAEVQALLPAGLERSAEVSFGPPDLVEIWFAG